MAVDPALLSVRFGTGRSPRFADPPTPADLVEPLHGPDLVHAAFPVPDLASIDADMIRTFELRTAVRNGASERRAELEQLQKRQFAHLDGAARAALARGLDSQSPLRERLVWFWADHFTVIGKGDAGIRLAAAAFVDEAIRPHVTGRFADMLKAAVMHPAMLRFLDQPASVGPNSALARRQPGKGLNENLARELLELHTLGVGGGYSQADVQQLAELLAGMMASRNTGFAFRPHRGEPGPEVILGKSYGRRRPSLDDIEAVLDDLAEHPDTARHIARKLAVHFVSDTPDPVLTDALAARFTETGGDLLAVVAALVEHPRAQTPEREKVRQPYDYVVAGLRALGVTGEAILSLPQADFLRRIQRPLARMGQPWQRPTGPDGWPEEAGHWATPQGVAARIDWAAHLSGLSGIHLPDPRQFVREALGPLATERLIWAAGAAETRRDGVTIVLAAPDFQRR